MNKKKLFRAGIDRENNSINLLDFLKLFEVLNSFSW